LLAHCADNNIKRFYFGRSTFDEGNYKFKKQWGAKPQTLKLQTFTNTGIAITGKEANADSPNRLRAVAENVWRKLPLKITIALGATVRPYISL